MPDRHTRTMVKVSLLLSSKSRDPSASQRRKCQGYVGWGGWESEEERLIKKERRVLSRAMPERERRDFGGAARINARTVGQGAPRHFVIRYTRRIFTFTHTRAFIPYVSYAKSFARAEKETEGIRRRAQKERERRNV